MTDSHATAPVPEPPPLLPASWGPLKGHIGPRPEDFRVDEIPLYEMSGEGEHLFLRLEKRELNTRAIVKEVSLHSGMSARDVGYAGMKDRHAVTTQWLSVASTDDPTTWDWSDRVRLIEHARHGNKLRTGHLEGNRFQIRLVGLEDASLLIPRAESLRSTGVFNGFDAQRFGLGGQNLAHALEWARTRRRTSRFKNKLYASVLQSHVFNKILATRSEHDLLHVLEGDVLRLDGSQSVFVSQDSAVDEARRLAGDVHLTAPMFGPKARAPEHRALEIERAAIDDLNLDEDAMAYVARNGKGTRRDLFLMVNDLEVTIETPHAAVVAFNLDSGAYATNIIRHLLRRGWSEPLRELTGGRNHEGA